jgi:Spy/CpxP family protein refolding chaperone
VEQKERHGSCFSGAKDLKHGLNTHGGEKMIRSIALSFVSLLLVGGVALAQPGPGKGMGPGRGGHGDKLCGPALLHAHPDVLKAKMGLNDAQIKKIQALRNNFASQRIKLQAQAQQLMLQMSTLLEADLPDQNKVIDLSRKIRGVRGQLVEEGIKTALKVGQILTKEQRTAMRAQCPRMGMGMGMGMGMHGGMGMGRGGMGRGGMGRGMGKGRFGEGGSWD